MKGKELVKAEGTVRIIPQALGKEFLQMSYLVVVKYKHILLRKRFWKICGQQWSVLGI